MPNYFSLHELIEASQEADVKQASQEYQYEKALQAEANAKSRGPTEISYNKLLQLMYGDDVPPPAPIAVPGQKTQEKKDERPVEAFPPPPTGRR